jgi:hypothetical protein
MKTIGITYVEVDHSILGIELVPEWNGIEAFNRHVAAVSKQKDWSMYFPMEAVIKFKRPDGTLDGISLIRINQPMKIII